MKNAARIPAACVFFHFSIESAFFPVSKKDVRGWSPFCNIINSHPSLEKIKGINASARSLTCV